MPALDNLSRVADISFTVARRVGSLALSTARQVVGMALERSSSGRTGSTWAPPPPVSTRPDPPGPVPEPAASAPVASEDEARAHVDREAVVVAQSADAGATEGAGAQIRVGEPWAGYGSLTAQEVNDRLASASPESLAVARLYETTHRHRVTVLREIDRRLAKAAR